MSASQSGMQRIKIDEESIKETLKLCNLCGDCVPACPWNVQGKTLLNVKKFLQNLQLNRLDAEAVWRCFACRACEEVCSNNVKILMLVYWLRGRLLRDNKAPPPLTKTLWKLYETGSSWGQPSVDRAKWADGLGLNLRTVSSDVLLYVGCAISYDARLHGVARAVSKLMEVAGVNFTVLGDAERCCGDILYQAGEGEFLKDVISQNVELFKSTGASKLVALSPHCFNMFKKVYPSYGLDVEVLHYTEFLANLLDSGKLRPINSYRIAVTYHDPCYLSRFNSLTEEPRRLIESVAELEEMPLSRGKTLCCGGGGGMIFSETRPEERPSMVRVRQAGEVGAEALTTSCPYCILNFEDSAKLIGSKLRVLDVAELLYARFTA